MCGTARFAPTAQVVQQLRPDRVGDRAPTFSASTTWYPGAHVPVLVKDGNERILTGMTWGFEEGERYNARCETVAMNRYWQEWYRRFRCVIPVESFREGGAWFSNSQGLILAAGIWRPVKYANPAGVWWSLEASMLTEQATGEVARFHSREPVCLSSNDVVNDWLSCLLDVEHLTPSRNKGCDFALVA